MTSTSPDTDASAIGTVEDAHRRRLSGLDPLLRIPPAPLESSTPIHVGRRSGVPTAVALHRIGRVDPGEPAAAWAPDVAHEILLRASRSPGSSATEMLDATERWLADHATEPADVRVDLASLDLGWSRALVDHRFTPVTVLAARPSRPRDSSPTPHLPFVRIRVAVVEDLERILPLAAAVQRFDAGTGAAPERPNPGALLAPELERDLTTHPGWMWVAERGGALVALCAMTPPPTSDWATARVAAERVGYLSLLYVEPSLRGTKVGSSLVHRAHHRAAEDGIPVTLVHHNPLNPLATPFWGRQGYRPLHTTWQRRSLA